MSFVDLQSSACCEYSFAISLSLECMFCYPPVAVAALLVPAVEGLVAVVALGSLGVDVAFVVVVVTPMVVRCSG